MDDSQEPAFILSEKDLQIMKLLAEGKTNPEIAADLSMSSKGLTNRLQKIFAHLGVKSRIEAVLVWRGQLVPQQRLPPPLILRG